MNIKWVGSPNYDTNRKSIKYIVIHWMAGTLAGTDAVFQDDARDTSAHYGIENDVIHQYVKEEHVAYHAGNYSINQQSIGIEHSASPERPASDATYQTSARLIRELCDKYNIPIDSEHIVPHNRYKATQCPGTMDISKLMDLARGQETDNTPAWASQNDRLLQDMHARSITNSDKREDWVDDDKFRNRVVDHIDTQEQTKQDMNTEIDSLHAVNKQQADMLDDRQKEIDMLNDDILNLQTVVTDQRQRINQLNQELEACESQPPCDNLMCPPWINWLIRRFCNGRK